MENIIQLRESDYKELEALANLNKKDIESKANALYKEKGTFGIDIKMSIPEDYDDVLKIKSRAYVRDWNGKFPIADEDKKKIVKFVEYRSEELFNYRFGDHLYWLNNIKKRYREARIQKTKFMVVTVLGWLMAATMFVGVLFS